jgi:hypothetical protein
VGSCGHVPSCQAINVITSQDPGTGSSYLLMKAPRRVDWTPRPISGRGGRQNGQTGGEIIPAHIYHREKKRRRGLLQGLVLFRLVVASPLQPGVVGSYPVWGICFPSHLPLEGTGRT